MDSKSNISVPELPAIFSSMLELHSTKLVDKIVTGQEFLSAKFDDLICQLDKLKVEMKTLKAENDFLKLSIKSLKDKTELVSNVVHRQEVEIDSRLRTEMSSNAILLGVPRVPNENTLDLVSKTCKTIGYDLDRRNVATCTRVSSTKKGSNPIRITFKDVQVKENFLQAKKIFGPLTVSMIQGMRWPMGWTHKVIIREDLSPLPLEILRTIKQHQTTLNIRYVWPGRNGVILIKHYDHSKPIAIKSREDLNKLLEGI